MPWDETKPMNERVRFIATHLEAGEPFSGVCERFGVSRKTGYKWVERYESDGVAGLEDRSRAPLSHPHAVADDVVEKILSVRKKHPRWGPRKLRVILQRHYPQLVLPATIHQRLGLALRKHHALRLSSANGSPIRSGARL